ncbi:YceD family protein [Tindallia californiensis]|uniref:Uncharacterized metal-binding protein YceD, DUF177 family n=1 Tax=Tindallia californiensis TaxID=159292 RepID=A0A1H3NTZ2_9FIRM|nr:DUF177 domain-containing protein [Tindallia californiensis]SDY92278.1 Uncharacterized metal-binding protein YceD, DUF177 family [Tindallia californiensis]
MFPLLDFFRSRENSLECLYEYDMPKLDYHGDPVYFKQPIEASVQLIKIQDAVIMNLEMSVTITMSCARCLEMVCQSEKVKKSFQLVDKSKQSSSTDSQWDEEIIFYSNNQLDLESVVHEQALLTVPLKLLCRHGCQGIRNRCGTESKDEECRCDHMVATTEIDPRLAKLKDWYQKE